MLFSFVLYCIVIDHSALCSFLKIENKKESRKTGILKGGSKANNKVQD